MGFRCIAVLKKSMESDGFFLHEWNGELHVSSYEMEYDRHNAVILYDAYKKWIFALSVFCGRRFLQDKKNKYRREYEDFDSAKADLYYEKLIPIAKEIGEKAGKEILSISIDRHELRDEYYDEYMDEDFTFCAKPSVCGPVGCIQSETAALLESFLDSHKISAHDFIMDDRIIVIMDNGSGFYEALKRNGMFNVLNVREEYF